MLLAGGQKGLYALTKDMAKTASPYGGNTEYDFAFKLRKQWY
ncbi:MAG: hypothetical protein ACLS48_13535 [[Eubacterium] siraeum]